MYVIIANPLFLDRHRTQGRHVLLTSVRILFSVFVTSHVGTNQLEGTIPSTFGNLFGLMRFWFGTFLAADFGS